MSDLTVYAEALIATVARAFYDDDAVCLIDVMIRDKFLRDDDMAPRLQLPAKKLRSTLQFLQEEHLVKFETVDDLAQGGSQATKFWYIDYNHAVHTIRLRLHLLRRDLEQAEMRARSSSFYLCPGYKTRRCNGRYTEEEAQQVVDQESGLFLCQECFLNFENDPIMSAKKDMYTLQLVDNTKELKLAIDNIRRINVQLSGKMIGSQQLRAGIYDLLQKVRGKGKDPITSNLPSENFALGRGSKRLAGTGRTAGIKARKLEQQGVAGSANAAKNILVGAGGNRKRGSGIGADGTLSDLTFLKNALGNEIAFAVEKGGGARANLLSQRHPNPSRKRRKLMDAAATRIGTEEPTNDVYVRLHQLRRNSKRGHLTITKNNETIDTKNERRKNGKEAFTDSMDWLNNNISRQDLDIEMERLRQQDKIQEEFEDFDEQHYEQDNYGPLCDIFILSLDDDDDENLTQSSSDENIRNGSFQVLYAKAMERQAQILRLENEIAAAQMTSTDSSATDEKSVTWEDG